MQIDAAELDNAEALVTYRWLRAAFAAHLRSDSEFEDGLRELLEQRTADCWKVWSASMRRCSASQR